ncbi:MAG: hypothetical protein L0H73_14235 [Nitrococcus sp.]|nr:hypothetical protein [Nitrococcus sp.]
MGMERWFILGVVILLILGAVIYQVRVSLSKRRQRLDKPPGSKNAGDDHLQKK